MSQPFGRFGSFIGAPGGDVRVQISGKGRKNVLTFTASYLRTTAAAPGVAFQGRLFVFEGQFDPTSTTGQLVPPPPDFTVFNAAPATPTVFDSRIQGAKMLFNAFLSSVGPHPFFLPLAQLEGSPQTDESNVINIVLCIGADGAGGTYRPSLSVGGQTVFGGALAGQSNFLGSVVA